MFKYKILFLFIGICTFITAHADDTVICPTVEEIKQDKFYDWLPLYKENEELISAKDLKKFKSNVTDLDVAKWAAEYSESAHCFYRGNDPIVDRIILGQDAWQPADDDHWSWLAAKKFVECRSQDVKDCVFLK